MKISKERLGDLCLINVAYFLAAEYMRTNKGYLVCLYTPSLCSNHTCLAQQLYAEEVGWA